MCFISFPLFSPQNDFFSCSSVWKRASFTQQRFEPELQQGLIEHRRLMKGKEDLFSRQPFICVCVFVPPSSVLQISQLREELKGVESVLNAPLSSLRFVPPHTHMHTQSHTHMYTNLSPLHSLTLGSSLDLSLSLCFPSCLPTRSPETLSSLSTLLSLFKLWTSQAEQMMFVYCTLCPLVLLLGNRPGWLFWRGFISCEWLCMIGMYVEEDKENRQLKQAYKLTHTLKHA